MPRQEPGRGRLLADDLNDIFATEIAGAPQESFFAFIMVIGIIDELRRIETVGLRRDIIRNRPTGKGARAFLYVILGVVELTVHPHTHREQFQQLPSVVLVDRPLVAETIV